MQSQDKKYPRWLIAKFSNIERGSRLIEKQIEELIVSSNLLAQEQDVFVEMLYNCEKAIAFE